MQMLARRLIHFWLQTLTGCYHRLGLSLAPRHLFRPKSVEWRTNKNVAPCRASHVPLFHFIVGPRCVSRRLAFKQNFAQIALSLPSLIHGLMSAIKTVCRPKLEKNRPQMAHASICGHRFSLGFCIDFSDEVDEIFKNLAAPTYN